MKILPVALLCSALALSALAEQPKASPDPILISLKAELKQVLQKLDPKPTFEFLDNTEGRTLTVRYKIKNYVVHPRRPKGGYAETTEIREGPSDQGFLLNAYVQPLGEVNQAVTPQVVREPYWDLYLNVYPVKNTQKQVYFCLSYNGETDRALIEKIKKVTEQLIPTDRE